MKDITLGHCKITLLYDFVLRFWALHNRTVYIACTSLMRANTLCQKLQSDYLVQFLCSLNENTWYITMIVKSIMIYAYTVCDNFVSSNGM